MAKDAKRPLENSKAGQPPAKKYKGGSKHTKSKTDGKTDGKRKNDDPPKTREEQRELHKHRKSQRTHADIMEEVKKLWDQLRVKDMEMTKRKGIVQKMQLSLKDNALLIVHKHDGARIIECYIKYADQARRSEIIGELIKDILPLIKSKYGKFVVFKILKYSSHSQKEVVMKCVQGHVLQLVKHKEGAHFIDTLFSDYCNEQARNQLVQEFFGMEYALFAVEGVAAKNLSTLFETLGESKKTDLLKDMEKLLRPVLNKDTVVYSIVHRALLEYFKNAPADAITDMILHIRELIPDILHTKDGAQVSVICIQRGTNKDRKIIIKALKPMVDKVAVEEYGFLVLCAIFDTVDDTVLVGKSLLQPIASQVDTISSDKYGWKTIMYLLQDRANKSVMNPTLQKLLGEGDDNPYSKKDRKVRRKELRSYVSNALAELCEANMGEWVLDFFSCLLLGEILLHAGIARSHMEALAALVGEQIELLENLNTHRLLKRLVKEDTAEEEGAVPFAALLADQLGGMPASAVTNQGAAFVLVALLESPYDDAKAKTAKALKTAKAFKTLEKIDESEHNAGTRVLLKHLQG